MMPQSPSIVAGIDLGSTTTRVIITEHAGTGTPPRVIGVGKSVTSGITKGYLVNETEALRSLQIALQQAESMASVKIDRVYITFGGISLETYKHRSARSLFGKEITQKDILYEIQIVNSEFLETHKNKSILHTVPLHYFLDGEEIFGDPIGMIGNELVIMYSLTVCLSQHREGFISLISRAGLDIVDIIASPVAASVVALPKRSRIAGAGLIDIGSETLSVSIFEHDALVHTAVISCGAGLITNDLALGLQISLDDAEEIKLGKEKTVVSKKKVNEIIEARIMDMLEIIRKKLITWNKDCLLPGGVALIGGGSHQEHIDTYFRNFLKLPVSSISPEKLIPSKRGLDASWFAVYGLCFLGDQQPEYRSTGVNLKKLFKDTRGSIKNFFEQFLP